MIEERSSPLKALVIKNMDASKPSKQSKGLGVGPLTVGTKALHGIKRVPQ